MSVLAAPKEATSARPRSVTHDAALAGVRARMAELSADHFEGDIAALCSNSGCAVSGIRVVLSERQATFRGIRCPSCRRPLVVRRVRTLEQVRAEFIDDLLREINLRGIARATRIEAS